MKNKILKDIEDMIKVIEECPELFHDGIDEEIVCLLKQVGVYIIKKG